MFRRFRRFQELFAQDEQLHRPVPPRPTRSLARDALIASFEPGKDRLWRSVDFTVMAALLAELAHEGRIRAVGEGRQARVEVVDPAPVGDEDLDDVLVDIRGGLYGDKVRRLVSLSVQPTLVLTRATRAGLVVEERRTVLGVVPVRKRRPTPQAGYDDLVTRLRGVLLGDTVPDDRTALLVAVLDVGLPLRFLVPRDRVREAEHRVRQIRDERVGEHERAVLSGVRWAWLDADD